MSVRAERRMGSAATTPGSGALEVLRRERDLLSVIVESARLLVMVFDRHGNVVRFNRACEEATGTGGASLLGKPFWDAFANGAAREAAHAAFRRLRTGGFPAAYETTVADRVIAWSHTALFDGSGDLEAILAVGNATAVADDSLGVNRFPSLVR